MQSQYKLNTSRISKLQKNMSSEQSTHITPVRVGSTHAPLFVPICIYLWLTLYLISSNIRYYGLFVGVRPEEANFPYNTKMAAYNTGTGVKPSYRGVAKCFGLNYRLSQWWQQNIGLSKHTSNAQKSHLTENEALTLIDFTIEMACRAFLLSLWDLEQHALKIVQLLTSLASSKHLRLSQSSLCLMTISQSSGFTPL